MRVKERTVYAGEQYDPHLDQYYLRARYYNQNVGRFHTMDDWAGVLNNPITLNKYLYGNGNPVMYVDPSGYYSIIGMMSAINTKYVLALAAVPLMGCSTQTESCDCRYNKKVRALTGNRDLFDSMDAAAKDAEIEAFGRVKYPNLNYEYGSQIAVHELPASCNLSEKETKKCYYRYRLVVTATDAPDRTVESEFSSANNMVYLGPMVYKHTAFWHNHPDDSNAVFSPGDYSTFNHYKSKCMFVSVRKGESKVDRNKHCR
jgi:RHS repeat-associated protein